VVTASRVLLSAGALDQLRLRTGCALPPGFRLAPSGGPLADLTDAEAERVDDLRVLASPEVAVLIAARRPDLEVTACLALAGSRGAALLRTSPTAVELSAFPVTSLAAELTRVVPLPPRAAVARDVEVLPLTRLLDRARPPLQAVGALTATVVAGGRGPVGALIWVLEPGGWRALEPLPGEAEPLVRVAPTTPTGLAAGLAPLLAAAAA
jgi:hypothetical protein